MISNIEFWFPVVCLLFVVLIIIITTTGRYSKVDLYIKIGPFVISLKRKGADNLTEHPSKEQSTQLN